MKFHRCLICGETYFGTEKPSNCPHCGARRKYLVNISRWVDENLAVGVLSDVSRGHLEKALQLEVNNAPFYRDAMNRTGSIELQGIFKYLSKIEAEHASAIIKLLKCELPPPEPGGEKAVDDDMENLRTAHRREMLAAAFYRNASREAVEPRVKRLFKALTEIETDHIGLEADLLEKLSG